jgi:hypothetical protein
MENEKIFSELQLVPTGDLLDEIHSRFDAVLFFAARKDSDNQHVWAFSSSGHKMLLFGMAKYLENFMEKKVGEMDFEL